MIKKLRNDRGETLVEVLASILIAALSVGLLFGCVMASSRMDSQARELDAEHYAALTAAELRLGTGVSGTVRIRNSDNGMENSLSVKIYGGPGLYSYKRADP